MIRSIIILAAALLPLCGAAPARACTVEINPLDSRFTDHDSLSLMAYIDINELKGKIPGRDLISMLDDNEDGVIDADVWAQIQADVQTEIDGALGQRYATPFADPLPAVVKLAAQVFAIEGVCNHRSLLNEKSPERINANTLRRKLSAIAKGEEALAPGKERARPSASAVTTPSRTHSDRPAI